MCTKATVQIISWPSECGFERSRNRYLENSEFHCILTLFAIGVAHCQVFCHVDNDTLAAYFLVWIVDFTIPAVCAASLNQSGVWFSTVWVV